MASDSAAQVAYSTRADGGWYVKAEGLELVCDGRAISIYKNNRLLAVRPVLATKSGPSTARDRRGRRPAGLPG